MRLVISLALLLLCAVKSNAQMWTNISNDQIKSEQRLISPQTYQAFGLQNDELEDFLYEVNQAPGLQAKDSDFILEVPMPSGKLEKFSIAYDPIMAEKLANKYPEIKTYAAQGIDNRFAVGRLDYTPAGFHGIIFSPNGTVYIDPIYKNDNTKYQSYFKGDLKPTVEQFNLPPCHPKPFEPEVKEEMNRLLKNRASQKSAPSGTQLRTYRLANAATGEYTAFHGGTVASAQAAIVTAYNRVNGIYEMELAIRLELVANNDLLIFTNSSSDPYNNSSASQMINANQDVLDDAIGNSSYDIGHVFSTGGGGLAGLGVVCRNNRKADGVTGLPSPTGDPFWVDYVAHEIGHQFAGSHTFNGTAGSCGANGSGSNSYEPGSGTTIQAYAGICGSHNTQNNSDDYFHTHSFDQMVAYSTTGSGNNCPVVTSTNNGVPVPNAGAGGYVIPINTPFTLTGSATDPDGDPMTYNWEQYDLGPAGNPNNPSGNAPIFRSFPATSSPSRTFPQESDLLNNTQTIGEILPSYGRNMNFRMTVRDNQLGGGGVDYDQISMTVDASSGPFLVLAPNTAVTWTGLSNELVTWDVANTNMSPVSCTNVDILLSTDGGVTFPITLASSVTNDGSHSIQVPDLSSTTARVKIVCSDNVFFDLSNIDFTIEPFVPLPVELVNIKATAYENYIEVDWSTAIEIDNRGFEIWRSENGVSEFKKIGWVDAGENSTTNIYKFNDRNAATDQTYYYRLSQIDFNGRTTLSTIVSAKIIGNEDWNITLAPNPASKHLSIINSGKLSGIGTINIFDVNGKLIYQNSQMNLGKGSSLEINLSSYAPGVYLLKGTASHRTITKRLIVKH